MHVLVQKVVVQQVSVLPGNGKGYLLDTAYGISLIEHVYTACVSVSVCVFYFVLIRYTDEFVFFQVFEDTLGYVVLFSILLWLDAWCACASVEMQFFQIASHAIAFVAESLSFVIECLGCVMAIFYRIWARAVSTSWRGALHQLYTRGGV